MKFTGTLREPEKMTASFAALKLPLSGGYEEGYADGRTAGYTEGEQAGYDRGVTDGVEQGKQAEYDRFWDTYLENGNITDTQYLFAGHGWDEKIFYPKYNVFDGVKKHNYTFFNNPFAGDLAERFASLGLGDTIAFGSSPTQSFRSMVNVTRLPVIGVSATTNLNYLFSDDAKLETIDKLIISNDGETTFTSTFNLCNSLKNIRFEGVIGKAISFPNSSLLTGESVQDIIDHLQDLTGKTAQTLTLHPTVGARLTADQKATITAKNWTLVY